MAPRGEGAQGTGEGVSEGMSLRYEFEEDNRRDANSEKGKAYARQFLKRLNGPTKKRDPTDEELPGVLDFVEQVHMNIEWYWRKAERQHHMKRVFDRILVIVGVAAALWTAIASVIPNGPAVGAIGVVLAVAMAVLKLIPEANDFQKHRQHFWNAAAKLKTQLYTLESEALKGSLKVFDPPESYTLTNEFKLRLAQDLTKAREICQEEQTDFWPCVEARASLCDRPSLPPRGEPRGYPVRSPASAGLVAVAWNARGPRMRAFRKVASGFTPGRAPSSAPGPREL